MPIHDWTRIFAGGFHHFHQGWVTRITDALNAGLLPPPLYAAQEQVAGRPVPDVLTLHDSAGDDVPSQAGGSGGGTAVAEAPPRVQTVQRAPEAQTLAGRKSVIAVRHVSGHRVVAMVEVVSPGNKAGRAEAQAIVSKVAGVVRGGCQYLLIDLLPPRAFDLAGLHDLVWRDLTGEGFAPPPDRPLTLASYRAGTGPGDLTAYVEPTAVGRELADMPLFVNAEFYVTAPLALTYASTFEAMPRPWRAMLES